jgi:glutaconyl-CoA decarboxylase
MPGNIVSVSVKVGDKLEAGDPVIILEAMKMQNEITSPGTGEVTSVECRAGDQVGYGDVLVTIDPSS